MRRAVYLATYEHLSAPLGVVGAPAPRELTLIRHDPDSPDPRLRRRSGCTGCCTTSPPRQGFSARRSPARLPNGNASWVEAIGKPPAPEVSCPADLPSSLLSHPLSPTPFSAISASLLAPLSRRWNGTCSRWRQLVGDVRYIGDAARVSSPRHPPNRGPLCPSPSLSIRVAPSAVAPTLLSLLRPPFPARRHSSSQIEGGRVVHRADVLGLYDELLGDTSSGLARRASRERTRYLGLLHPVLKRMGGSTTLSSTTSDLMTQSPARIWTRRPIFNSVWIFHVSCARCRSRAFSAST